METMGDVSKSTTPIHDAVRAGDLSELKKLVGSGANLASRDCYGMTPLMCAVERGCRASTELLVSVSANEDLGIVNDSGYNVLHYIVWCRRPWAKIIEKITDKNPDTLKRKNMYGYLPIDLARITSPENPAIDLILEQLTRKQEEMQQQQQRQLYVRGISRNEENPCNITITVAGHQGAGKSCLVQQLMQEYFPEDGPGSTNIADFHVNYLGYNPETGLRLKLDEDGEIQTERRRLKRLIDQRNQDETADVQTSTFVDRSTSSGFIEKLKELFSRPASGTILKDTDSSKVQPSVEQRRAIEEVMTTKMDDWDDFKLKGHVTIYDFGGEKVFYNTHHCFMSSNMVFVLVFDVAMCLDRKRSKDGYCNMFTEEILEFWLKAFATYAIGKKGKGTPPVILVGSHMDLVSPHKEKQEELFLKVIDKLHEKPEIGEIIDAHVQDRFPIANLNDCTTNQGMYERIWNRIIEIAPLQSHWMKPVPARWVALEYELVRLKHAGKVILTYDELIEINHKLTVPLDDPDIMNFLMRLRFAGSFLCFDIHSRNPFIILQPQWIIDAFKAVITDRKFTTDLSVSLRILWTRYEKSGVLPHDLAKKLWGRSATYRFLDEEGKLIIAMETLGLLTQPISDDVEVDYFIVPSILPAADPEIICPLLVDPDTVTTVTLCIRFDSPFIQQAIWDKMIANCIHRFQRFKEFDHDDHKFIQRGLACLSVDRVWNMIINCKDNAMKVTMFKKDKCNTVPPGPGINLLKVLEFLLRRILELNHQSHLRYHFYLHNDFRFAENEKLVKVEDLHHYESLQCNGSNGTKWIDRNDLYVWFRTPNQKATATYKSYHEMPKELPDRKLSYKEMGRVSKYIGSTYMTFFAELDCPVALMEQEMEEHRHLTFRSRITKIFVHLCKTRADTGVLAVAEAMSRHRMNPLVLFDILNSNRDMMFKDETLSVDWLNKHLSVNDVPIIAGHVDIKAYFNLFLELGLTPTTVDEFDDQYRNRRTREKITALLKAFITETKPRPTVNAILVAMEECEMDTTSLITAMKH